MPSWNRVGVVVVVAETGVSICAPAKKKAERKLNIVCVSPLVMSG